MSEKHDYAAVLEDMLTLEGTTFSQYTDAAYQYERVLHKHFDTIRHALRFAEKMCQEPSEGMSTACFHYNDAFTQAQRAKLMITHGVNETFKSMRDAALKELGE